MALGINEMTYGFGRNYEWRKGRREKAGMLPEAFPDLSEAGEHRSGRKAEAGLDSAMELYRRMRRMDLPEETAFREGGSEKSRADKTCNGTACSEEAEAEKEAPDEEEEPKSDTEIIVKPDGSRVLVMNISVGGMKSSMTLEISGPTAMQNDCGMGDERELGLAVDMSEES